jgi:hypothetical protein
MGPEEGSRLGMPRTGRLPLRALFRNRLCCRVPTDGTLKSELVVALADLRRIRLTYVAAEPCASRRRRGRVKGNFRSTGDTLETSDRDVRPIRTAGD